MGRECLCKFEVSIVYKFRDSQGYTGKPWLEKQTKPFSLPCSLRNVFRQEDQNIALCFYVTIIGEQSGAPQMIAILETVCGMHAEVRLKVQFLKACV